MSLLKWMKVVFVMLRVPVRAPLVATVEPRQFFPIVPIETCLAAAGPMVRALHLGWAEDSLDELLDHIASRSGTPILAVATKGRENRRRSVVPQFFSHQLPVSHAACEAT